MTAHQMYKIHQRKPIRSATIQPRNRYQEYRAELRRDFNNACGYCDDSDELQDKSVFHIDHFAPKSRFPEKKEDYQNLVYSCRFCNSKKSNKWVTDSPIVPNDGIQGFIDPCDQSYDEHIYRDTNGAVRARTSLGQFMISSLNLGLLRHEYLWKARQLRNTRVKLTELLAKIPKDSFDERLAILEAIHELVLEYEEYFKWSVD